MAGGGAKEPGLTDSILEVPTFTIALVLIFFLVCSLAFERCVEWLKHKLKQKGRLGLVEALQKLVMELTLLGFISLLLTSFQGSLQKLCVDYSSTLVRWTLLENINGCPCCLKGTYGISACAQIAHGCLYNSSSGVPYCGCNVEDTDALPDCLDYRSMELTFYMQEVRPSIEVFSRVVHVAYPNTTVEEVCDDFCQIVNATFANLSDSEGGSAAQRQLLGEFKVAPMSGFRLPLLEPLWQGQLPPSYQHQSGGIEGDGWGEWEGIQSPPVSRLPRRLQQDDLHFALAADSGERGSLLEEDMLSYILDQDDPTDNLSDSETHFIPERTTFRCTGPFLAGNCPEGQVPAISYAALHQIHLLIFLVAIFHVVVSVLMIVLAGYRLRQWRRWQVESVQSEQLSERAASSAHTPISSLSPPTSFRSAAQPSTEVQLAQTPPPPAQAAGAGVPATAAAAGAAIPGTVEDAGGAAGAPPPPSSQPGSRRGTAPAEGQSGGGGASPGDSPALGGIAQADGGEEGRTGGVELGALAAQNGGVEVACPLVVDTAPKLDGPVGHLGGGRVGVEEGLPTSSAEQWGKPLALEELDQVEGGSKVGGEPSAQHVAATWQHVQRKWGRRSTLLRRRREYWAEGGTWLLQAFMPNLVRRHQFLLIRSAHVAHQEVADPCDFVSQCMHRLELDAACMVGISLEMWVVVVLWVLLVGLAAWTSLLFMWGAAALLLLVNVMLVGMLRYACRGSQPHLPSSSHSRRLLRWLKAELLLVPIRMVLFLCSLVYSTTVFMAWQFGGASCFFTAELDVWATAGANLPWWSSLILCSILLLWVSLVTIPAYSLAVHATRSRPKEQHAQQVTAASFLQTVRLGRQSAVLCQQAEVDVLQAEIRRLQKLLSLRDAAT